MYCELEKGKQGPHGHSEDQCTKKKVDSRGVIKNSR
jgi:hypothetical protein